LKDGIWGSENRPISDDFGDETAIHFSRDSGLGHHSVIPANAGIQGTRQWIPALAGMTVTGS
jgi:hypothetical protein